MKKKYLAVLCLLASFLFVNTANGERSPEHKHLPPLMKALDLDKDGQLSDHEISMATKVLRRLDKNRDGILTMKEAVQAPPKENQRLSKYIFKRDKNGDGKLTSAELGKGFEEFVELADTNKDGVLTRKEVLFGVDKYSSKPIGSVKGDGN